jgi:hypothetical protein
VSEQVEHETCVLSKRNNVGFDELADCPTDKSSIPLWFAFHILIGMPGIFVFLVFGTMYENYKYCFREDFTDTASSLDFSHNSSKHPNSAADSTGNASTNGSLNSMSVSKVTKSGAPRRESLFGSNRNTGKENQFGGNRNTATKLLSPALSLSKVAPMPDESTSLRSSRESRASNTDMSMNSVLPPVTRTSSNDADVNINDNRQSNNNYNNNNNLVELQSLNQDNSSVVEDNNHVVEDNSHVVENKSIVEDNSNVVVETQPPFDSTMDHVSDSNTKSSSLLSNDIAGLDQSPDLLHVED